MGKGGKLCLIEYQNEILQNSIFVWLSDSCNECTYVFVGGLSVLLAKLAC